MTQDINNVQQCTSMDDVRRHIDALDAVLVPCLVTRCGYMTQEARHKKNKKQIRDEETNQEIID